jgi:osmotically-inducible protein OsmY
MNEPDFKTDLQANDLVVHPPTEFQRSDTDIAQSAVTALKWSPLVPTDVVSVTLANGWLTLNGRVECQYQKDAAAAPVRGLNGVRGVANDINVQADVNMADVQARIEAAFKKSAESDARGINVLAQNGKVILSGNVHSWAEREDAERAAWAVAGVTQVEDRLAVVP